MSVAVHKLLNRAPPDILSPPGGFPVDPEVLSKFPAGTKILSAVPFGTSAWTITACLQVELPGGSTERYFLKCASDDSGRALMEGEFHAMSALFGAAPDFVPKPHSWGEFRTREPRTYFFLSQFIEMSDRVPEPNQLCKKLARLHRDSVSPTGMFGFHINTCQGRSTQEVGWDASWAACFTKMLRHVMQLDVKTNGHWAEFEQVGRRVTTHVIPRLIGALESDGRSIKPCLIHADLWEGNTGTSYDTGAIYIFDAASFYAHNEMEIGDWRCPYNKIHNKVYTRTYLRHFGPSEPKEEWDDRNRMYCVYYNVIYSVNHTSQGKAVRQRKVYLYKVIPHSLTLYQCLRGHVLSH
ncbi:Fructosamine kinase-domain-containing protein [Macrophomina phaseolina]|uniref:protein-ribulosamine 3-kinase n=1 Tax=Macrophomina phaseolina TaxID=35725 RepID=A0ABQ8G963_9PEZI|nr:Fructosamine kinase-domain-containing protein [Macrophomina phaseolina]